MAANNDDTGNDRNLPRNLQGLLNFCTEVTKAEDAPQTSQREEMTAEKRDFLEKVLNGLQGDDLKYIAQCLEKLTSNSIENEDDDISEQEKSLDDLADYVEDLNFANDVKKMNGFPVLIKCLHSPHFSLQKKAATVIGNICQNNLDCQKDMTMHNIMPILLDILENHQDPECRIKVLYAVSCLVRDFPPAEDDFVRSSGFSILMKSIQSENPKLIMKSTFLLNHFIQKNETFKESLLSMGFIEQFIIVLFADASTDDVKEYCIKSILDFCLSLPSAVAECLRPEFKFIEYLEKRKQYVANKEEFAMTEEDINSLLQLLTSNIEETEASSMR